MNTGRLLGTLAIMLAVFFGIKQLQAGDGLDARQAYAMVQQGALLLDVREPDEYATVHVQNARLIPLGQLASRLPELADWKDKPIVVMCRSGNRSAKAVNILREAGYRQASNMKGGIMAWESEGLEVVKQK